MKYVDECARLTSEWVKAGLREAKARMELERLERITEVAYRKMNAAMAKLPNPARPAR